jgi:phospholipid N-methyltransferase
MIEMNFVCNVLAKFHQITTQQELRIVDFGSGKGYLTFALYDYLQQQQKTPLITLHPAFPVDNYERHLQKNLND